MAKQSKPRGVVTTNLSPRTLLRGGMARALGVRVVSLQRNRVVGEMRIKPIHLNVNGHVNGGAIMTFGDILGAIGAVANRPPGHRGGTIESKTNFLAVGTKPLLKAVSIPLHVGRTTTVWQTTVKNTDGRAVAIITQTQIHVPIGRGSAAGAGEQ